MNKFINAVKELDLDKVKALLEKEPGWATWREENGKTALHYLGGVKVDNDTDKAAKSLQMLQLLLKAGMDMNAVHSIAEEGCDIFPATPLWYAYTKGRNEKLFTYLLKNGAEPNHCMFAIAWNDDVEAARLFKKHGAVIESTAFLGGFNWKRFKISAWFLQNGADVNFADEHGNTALLLAVKKKYPIEEIQMLLECGADINKENKMGISPKKLAETNRQRKILQFFESYAKSK
jgi:ankyrin repeat protein